MIRAPMESHNQTTTELPQSKLAERTTVSTNNESSEVFRLEPWKQPKSSSKIWTLTFDLPGEKVNKLSQKVIREFDTLLSRLESMGSKKEIEALVLVSGKPGNFIAGADIEM